MSTSTYSDWSSHRLLDRLAEIRTTRVRLPVQVSLIGQVLVQRGELNKDSDQAWTVKEQVALASIESGQLSLASVLVDRLASRFPTSPRVLVLQGQLLEAQGHLVRARQLYEERIAEVETDTLARKRLIALHLSVPLSASSFGSTRGSSSELDAHGLSRQRGIDLLVDYLETYYIDAEGWILLAKSYAELGLYAQSLSSLSHAVLLHPQNPFLLLLRAETAYTLRDYPTSWKEYMRVIEMATDTGKDGKVKRGQAVRGVARRAAFGAKMCIPHLRSSTLPKPSSASSASASLEPSLAPSHLDELDLVLTKLILASHETSKDGAGRTKAAGLDAVRKWLGGDEASGPKR
ncbi:hypothetical protein JCM10212_000574 [Sporobolomyces blumeae]